MKNKVNPIRNRTFSNGVKVGVIGLGMGRAHLAAYRELNQAQVIAICDIDAEKLSQAQKKYEVPYTFTDYDKILQMDELDAVSVATPNFLHAPVSIAALKAGKDVLCEKPLAMNSKEAREMLKVKNKTGRRLAVNFNNRFRPETQFLRNYIQEGNLGKIYYARTVWNRRQGIPPGAKTWFTDKEKSGGGPLIDLGVHRIDLALWLLGYPHVLSVSGLANYELGQRIAKERKTKYDVEDFATALIRLEGNIVLHLECSWISFTQKREDMSTQILGTLGGVEDRNLLEGHGYEVKIFHQVQGIRVESTPREFPPAETPQEHFVNCILNHKEPMNRAEEALVINEIMDAIYLSSEKGREVTLKEIRSTT